jgi:hypothetical protein
MDLRYPLKEMKYLGVIFDSRVTWRKHIDLIVIKVKISSFLKSERLSTKSKLILHKALMRSKMTYAYPAREFAADSHLLKFQRLQNVVLRTVGNLPKRTATRALHPTFRFRTFMII